MKDSRLGFHSESENYRFFPEKLEARITFLKTMLENPLPELPAEVQTISGQWFQADQYKWRMEDTGRSLKIYAVFAASHRVDQLFAAIQGRPETPPIVIGVTKNNEPILHPADSEMKASPDGDGWKVEFSIPWEKIQFRNGTFRIALTRFFVRLNATEFSSYPDVPVSADTLFRLGIGYHRPQYMLTFRRNV